MIVLLASCHGSDRADPGGSTTLDNKDSDTKILDPRKLRALADKSQLDIVDKPGEVSFDDYRTAVSRSLECMRDEGIDVIGEDQIDRSRGFPIIAYSFSGSSPGRSDEETLAVADDCLYRFSDLVDSKYQSQASSVEAEEALYDNRRPQIIACLEQAGRHGLEHVDNDRLRQIAFKVLTEQDIDCEG